MQRFLILLSCLFLIVACGGGADEPDTPPGEPTLEGTPVATLTPDPDAALSDETSVIDTLANLSEFQSMTALIRQVELTDKLQSAGPYVLLAPTDAAFEALPEGVLAGLTADETDLADVVMYHIIEGDFDSDALRTADAPIPTLLGDDFDPGDVEFGEELPASNGRVYPINQVLIPPSVEINSPEADQETVAEEAEDAEEARAEAEVAEQSDAPEEPTAEPEAVTAFPEQQIIDEASASGTILDVVSSAEELSLISELLNATELARTLSEDAGPFTFFAPTNDAVNALGEETLSVLLGEPRARLAPILGYHLTNSAITSVELIDIAPTNLLMVDDAEALISVEGDAVFIDDAQIIQYDIEAENGLVHVIDTLLVPPTERESLLEEDSVLTSEQATEDDNRITIDDRGEINNLLDTLIAASDATIFVSLLEDADLTDLLQSNEEGPFTIFAPTDSAFRDLPEGTLEALSEGPVGNLAPLLLAHIVPGEFRTADLADGELDTLTNQPLTIALDGDIISVNGAQVVASDIIAEDGVIHFIDDVLLID